jgi:acetoacetyl-CoA reductase
LAQIALVTGGTRGIGAAISTALAQKGYIVTANYGGCDKTADAFKTETGIPTYKWDVSDPDACAAGIAQIEKDVGPVDVLVNNAGITDDSMFHKMTWDKWSSVIRVNLDSMFAMTRPVIEGMRERGYGRIINISSINGQKGQLGQTNYAAAKAGLIGFTKALALETAAKGITVNCVCPGYIDTGMVAAMPEKVLQSILGGIPAGRLGQADEIAAAVVYLAGKEASFVTGSTLTINGGQYMV